MKLSDFKSLNLENPGIYRVVPEELLSELLKAHALISSTQPGIGYLIRHFRKLGRLSQKELAARVGTSQKHIDKIEQNGIKRPSDELLEKLGSTLGTDFIKLVDLI